VFLSVAHDFFAPQPVKDAAVFVMRFITHDWSNAYAQKILRRLRDAAQPTTKLVLIDFVIPYAVREPTAFSNIPGAEQPSMPEPLIPNAVSGWIGTASSLQVSPKIIAVDVELKSWCILDDERVQRSREDNRGVCRSW
jgi:hypothetical protein